MSKYNRKYNIKRIAIAAGGGALGYVLHAQGVSFDPAVYGIMLVIIALLFSIYQYCKEDVSKYNRKYIYIIKCIIAVTGGGALGYSLHDLGASFYLEVYASIGVTITLLWAIYRYCKEDQNAGEGETKEGEEKEGEEKGGAQEKSSSPSEATNSQTKKPGYGRTRGKRVKQSDTPKLGILGLFLVSLFCVLVMTLFDGRRMPPDQSTLDFAETKNPAVEVSQTPDPPEKESANPEVPPEDTPPPTPAPTPSPTPWISEVQWQSDPYFINVDDYCNYPVPEEEKGAAISNLLTGCLERIVVRGPFPDDDLNGAGSEYAFHTKEAGTYEDGRDRLADGISILPKYQREFNEQSAIEREAADGFYEVCDNEMCLGHIYLMLGDSYKQEDTSKAMEYYDAAFQIYEKAYRTGIAEGIISISPLNNSLIKQQLTSYIIDASEKMNSLGMHTTKQENALLVAAAFEGLLPNNVG